MGQLAAKKHPVGLTHFYLVQVASNILTLRAAFHIIIYILGDISLVLL